MKAGFIGLGNMGQAMAHNLIKAGHELLVYNRTRSRADELAGEGAIVAASVAEACTPGLVMTMLADDGAVEEMVIGNGGILHALPEGGIHVSFSTIGVALARRLAESHQKRGRILWLHLCSGGRKRPRRRSCWWSRQDPAERWSDAAHCLRPSATGCLCWGLKPWLLML